MTETILDAAAGLVKCDHRKVAIIGAGPGRRDAPFYDPSYCVWALNEIRQPTFTRHFELHPMQWQNVRELAWLESCPTPCYVLDLKDAIGFKSTTGVTIRPPVNNAVQFPLDRLRAAGFREYYTCTFAMQIALALLEGFEAIGLWGVELFLGTARERVVERACVEYWLGFAEGRGVKIVEDSSLAHHRSNWRYGYDYVQERDAVEAMMLDLGDVIERQYGSPAT